MSRQDNASSSSMEFPKPSPTLKRLERLVGTWELSGRTLGAAEDNIRGRITIQWLPGGFFLEQRGEIEVGGFKVQSLEIVGYDSATDTFPAYVYSNLGESHMLYHWDVQGDVVTHWTSGSKYTGSFNEDGTILAGGWRPDAGVEQNDGNTYDATMTRV